MEKKSFFGNWIVKNILLAAAAILGLVVLLMISLALITHHNSEIVAPDFTNLTLSEARRLADSTGVRVEVTDSVFIRQMRKGAVYNQSPKPGSKVKKGRRIELTTNTRVAKKIPMPSLVGFSMSQAKGELQAKGLVLGRLNYTRDIATNNVLQQTYKGREIAPGTLIEVGSTINLTVGLNSLDGRTFVPKLEGQKYARAVNIIQDNSLNVGKISFDGSVRTYSDTLKAVVYKQSPAYGRKPYTMGTEVSLYLTVDPVKLKDVK